MSITVRDCLQLPSLSMGKVIAGSKGLNAIVNTISVIEFDDYDDDFYVPNELVISSLYAAKGDVAEQCRIISHSKMSGDVGLVLFYADVILHGIDAQIIDTANHLNFPLILLPEKNMGLKYSDVINDVMEAILIDRRSSNFFVNNTMGRISQLPDTERNINTVLSLASDYSKASLFLCDEANNIIGSSYWPAGNDLDYDIFNSSESTYKLPFVDKRGARLVLHAISHYDKLNPQLMSQTVEVIQLFSTIWNYNLLLSSEGALIPAIFDGDLPLVHLIEKESGFDTSKIDTAVFIDFHSGSGKSHMLTVAKEKLRNIFADYEVTGIIDIYSTSLVLLYEHAVDDTRISFFADLTDCLNNISTDFDLAVNEKVTSTSSIHEFHIQYLENMETARKLYPSVKIFNSWQIGFAGKCKALLYPSFDADTGHPLKLLEPIIEDKNDDLLETLTVFLLDAGSEVKLTSEIMFVHRNTILYRLNKAKKLLGGDFNEMPFAYDVYLAVAMARLKSEE